MKGRSDPEHLSHALSRLISQRGLARAQGASQLAALWREIAGEELAGKTRVLGIRRGVLNVGVANSALLGELAAFHKAELLATLAEKHPELQIRDLKFRLQSHLGER